MSGIIITGNSIKTDSEVKAEMQKPENRYLPYELLKYGSSGCDASDLKNKYYGYNWYLAHET